MLKCGGSGAAPKYFAMTALLIATIGQPAAAKEFANVLGAAIDAQNASIEILAALSDTFAVIRDIDARGATFQTSGELANAADRLKSAGDRMLLVAIDPKINQAIDYSLLDESDRAIIEIQARRYVSGQNPRTLVELYRLCAIATLAIAELLRSRTPVDAGPVLPAIGDELSDYIRFGAAASRVFSRIGR